MLITAVLAFVWGTLKEGFFARAGRGWLAGAAAALFIAIATIWHCERQGRPWWRELGPRVLIGGCLLVALSLTSVALAKGAHRLPPPGTTVLVDNSDPGFSWGGSTSSPYRQNGNAANAVNGKFWFTENFLPCRGDAASTRNSAMWTATLPAEGIYEVWVNVPSFDGLGEAVPYHVSYGGGAGDFSLDQQNNMGHWVQIARLGFHAGTYSVTMSDLDGKYNCNGINYRKHLIADAVKWVYQGPG
jgi:hypothetical protein